MTVIPIIQSTKDQIFDLLRFNPHRHFPIKDIIAETYAYWDRDRQTRLSYTIIYKHLKTLMEENKVYKIGKLKQVKYTINKEYAE